MNTVLQLLPGDFLYLSLCNKEDCRAVLVPVFDWFGMLIAFIVFSVVSIIKHEIKMALIFGVLAIIQSIATIRIIRKYPDFF